jgi:polyisoprenoid-binding protein YceI
MTTLQSDDDHRDNSIHMRGLETDAYPTATFELTEPIDVGRTPQSGQTFTVDAVGKLTLHGVTRTVTVPIKGRWTGSRIEVVASFDVALADYSITPPSGFVVLSIADQGKVEMHLLFARS